MALPVALAFADASIVLLALPELVARLHTSISHVIWVIVVYNLALIAGSIVVRFAPRMPPVEPLLVGGLLLFGAASLAAGLFAVREGATLLRVHDVRATRQALDASCTLLIAGISVFFTRSAAAMCMAVGNVSFDD